VSPFAALKFLGGPGSIGFLAAACVVALFLSYVWPRRPPLGRYVLLAVFTLYIVLGLPVVSDAIASRLPGLAPVGAHPVPVSLHTLIILDGDNPRGRLQEGVRIWKASSPQDLVVSGQRWLVDELLAAGIPRDRLRQDSSASNTREQMDWVARLAVERPSRVMALVASRLQMPRVYALARARGLTVRLIASPVDSEPAIAGPRAWVPSYAALRVSRDALYELAALEYYRYRGWIGGQ
jgi:uncharacterized SAM-binding protein YcdF (DUF218 family)